jgi:hypothetical protein
MDARDGSVSSRCMKRATMSATQTCDRHARDTRVCDARFWTEPRTIRH